MSPGLIQLHLSVEFCVLLGRAMSQKSRDDRAKQEPSPHGAMGSLQDQSATQGINFSYPQYLGDLPAGSAIPWALSSFFRDHTDSLTWLLAGLNLSLTSIPVLHCGLNNPTPTPTPTPIHTPSTPKHPQDVVQALSVCFYATLTSPFSSIVQMDKEACSCLQEDQGHKPGKSTFYAC